MSSKACNWFVVLNRQSGHLLWEWNGLQIRFEGMCDYGFGKKEELPDRETWIPGTMELGETSESLAVLPPLFSKVDLPLDYAFKLGKPILSNKEHAKRYDMLYGGICFINPACIRSTTPWNETKRMHVTSVCMCFQGANRYLFYNIANSV